MPEFSLQHVDYSDRYVVALPEAIDAPRFCESVLRSAPRWLERLLAARDAVAGPLGFNTQERHYGGDVEVAPGRKFGPLIVQSVSESCVVCGDSDRHVTFRAIFEIDPTAQTGSFMTQVQLNDRIGRIYFAAIKPFHRRIVPALISAPFPGRAAAVAI